MLLAWRERAGILSIFALPLASALVAILGRSTFWFVSEDLLLQLPTYVSLLLAIEIAQYSASRWLVPRLEIVARISRVNLLVWGVYQLAAGIAMIQLFPDEGLWLGSTVLVYAGFAAIILWAFVKTKYSARRD